MPNHEKFSVQNVINTLLAQLSDRSKDVIVSRFGIGREDYETLEAIGERYGITRERVRQIEADALKQIRAKRANIAPLLASLENFVNTRGGVVGEDVLTAEFASQGLSGLDKPELYRGLVSLLLNISDQFKKAPVTDTYLARWYTSEGAIQNQEKVVAHIASELKKLNKVVDENNLISLATSSFPNLNRGVVLNYLGCSGAIGQNVFGQWGLGHWGEVNPRGVKDKAYLVMKQAGEPLHFRQVAEHINKHGFSNRTALAQTVHNELIKDNRFVLVGRGLYALREWGYKEGTVKDVIGRILKKNGPMDKEKVVKAVLAERFVKPSTIILNLGSFEKNEDGKYTLV